MQSGHDCATQLERVRGAFEKWRQTRRVGERIPESLWVKASDLTEYFSISQVSRWLRLSYTELKKRVHGPKPREQSGCEFVALDVPRTFYGCECIIEMYRGDGSGMKITLRSPKDYDPADLAKAFWKDGP
jgi:hypothetical protein